MPEVMRFAHHMSDEDALMWNIEKDPILRSTIIAVAMFDGVPDWNVLRRRMERTSRLIPRFRQRVLSPPLRMGPPRWTVVHWVAELEGLPSGEYELRCRSIDRNGIAQPMPRPFAKGGRSDDGAAVVPP